VNLGLMVGVHGQELIDGGLARQVLRAYDRMLRRIHAINPKLATEVVGLIKLTRREAGRLAIVAFDCIRALLRWHACVRGST
jgi:hypothetical protein